MNNVSIFQNYLSGIDGRNYRVAILRCDFNAENPRALLDQTVSKYVDSELYNEFIEINLDNPYYRVIICGINELKYLNFKSLQDVEFYEQKLEGLNHQDFGKIAIFRGGLNSATPIVFMNSVVREYVGQQGYNEFVEIHLDNPWVRIVITELNLINFKQYNNEKIYGSI